MFYWYYISSCKGNHIIFFDEISGFNILNRKSENCNNKIVYDINVYKRAKRLPTNYVEKCK